MGPIRVVVADDQRVIREALAMLLDNESDIVVVGQASDGEAAVTLAAGQGAQVVLMDLRMPGTDGVEATRRLAERHPEIKVVVLTTYADDESISEALVAGAIGYLTKDAGHREIALAVRSAATGQTVLDPAVHSDLLRRSVGTARDRNRTLHFRGHRQEPHQPSLRKDRRPQPCRGGPLRLRARPHWGQVSTTSSCGQSRSASK